MYQNQQNFDKLGLQGFHDKKVHFICKNSNEWQLDGSGGAAAFLTIHVLIAITTVVQGEATFYAVPKLLNYFKDFTEAEKLAGNLIEFDKNGNMKI